MAQMITFLRLSFVCIALSAAAFSAPAARACYTALLLSMDVSNSVDPGEYRLQVDGLVAALGDAEVREIMVRDQVALSVMQWSGVDRQEISIPWQQMLSDSHVSAFAAQVQSMKRAFVFSDTAPADALMYGLRHLRDAPQCARQVIDVSGDGTPNAGGEISQARRAAERAGVIVNGLAIEGLGIAITNFYRRKLTTRDGFVITARGHRDYARAIRIKLIRELSKVLG